NSPSFEEKAVLKFFETASRNLLAAEAAAGVGHHVALTVVAAARLPDSGYMRAKAAQEKLTQASKTRYTIVRSTQVFEFAGAVRQPATEGNAIRLSPALLQPIAADDVASALAAVAMGKPVNGVVELAGPERIPLDVLVRSYLEAAGDRRQVIADIRARYFGTELDDRSLTPDAHPILGATRFEDWLLSQADQA